MLLASSRVQQTASKMAQDPTMNLQETLACINMFEQVAKRYVESQTNCDTFPPSDRHAILQDCVDSVVAWKISQDTVPR